MIATLSFFIENVYITTISFYWRNNTTSFVTWRSRMATAPDTPTCIVILGGQFTGGRGAEFISQINSSLRLTGRLAQLVERRTREHNVSGLYRCGFESQAGQLKLLIVFRMRRQTEVPCDGAIRRAR